MISAPDSELRDEHHVVRYIKPTLIYEDGRIDGSAFRLRSGESGLSINWLEHFEDHTKAEQLERVRRLSRMTMRRQGRLAELNVGKTKRETRDVTTLRFERRPLAKESRYPADPSHCELFGLPDGGSPRAALVGDLIASTVAETYPAVTNSP